MWSLIYNYDILGIDLSVEEINQCLKENDMYYEWKADNPTWWDFAYTYVRQLGFSNEKSILFADIIVYFYDEQFIPEEYQDLYEKLEYEFHTEYDEYNESEKMLRFFYHVVDVLK